MTAAGCGRKDNDELAHHHHHEGHGYEHHEGHDHDHGAEADDDEGADVIVLEPSAAALFDLATDTAGVRELSVAVKTGGTVIASAEGSAVVSAPTSGIVTLTKGLEPGSSVGVGTVVGTVSAKAVSGGDANLAAKAELEAARAEYERAESLYGDRLVTFKEYNSAKAAYEKARAAYSSAASSGKAISPIRGVITGFEALNGQYVEAGAPIATVSAADRLLVRAEVPARSYRSIASARDARILLPDGSALTLSEHGGRRVGDNAAAASSGGYVPVMFSVANDGSLLPGESVQVILIGDQSRRVMAVPASAVTEQQGTYFVFEQIDEDCYRRLPVKIGAGDGLYIEVVEGLAGGERIVTRGVTAVKLAMTSGTVPEGHSH